MLDFNRLKAWGLGVGFAAAMMGSRGHTANADQKIDKREAQLTCVTWLKKITFNEASTFRRHA